MRAWVVAAMVAGMSLSVAAQSGRTGGPALPSAPEPSSTALTSSASAPGDPPAFVTPTGPPTVYTPLTSRQKFHIFVQQTYSIYTVANTAFDAGWAQLTDDWPAYGQGMEGYGKRYGALLANHEAGSFFENFLFPTVLHQDPRYFRMGRGHSIFSRGLYAASRVLITRADSGRSTFNSSSLLGLLFVDSLTNAYYPRPQRGFDDTMSLFGGGVLSNAETNLLREFGPDMMRIFHRHEPKKIKELEELEQKVPLADKFSPPPDPTVQPPKASGTAPAPAAKNAEKTGTSSGNESSTTPTASGNPGPTSKR
jgi:hypothetical protein